MTTEPTYRQLLSPQSIVTFEIQGGPMTEPEQARFAADADFDALITLRRADDAAKVPGREVRVLDDWREALRDLSG